MTGDLKPMGDHLNTTTHPFRKKKLLTTLNEILNEEIANTFFLKSSRLAIL